MHRLLTPMISLIALVALAGCAGSQAPSPSGTATATSPGGTNDAELAARVTNPANYPGEPPLDVPEKALAANLYCTGFTHPDKRPVLLVHGTFTRGQEQYDWNYIPLLVQRGYDVCAVTYPDRGLGDQQVSAEYVVYALRYMHAKTGHKVEMIGHSQGATMPRWAIKFWPSARNAVEDFVMQAGPNHGTSIGTPTTLVAKLTSMLGLSSLPLGVFPAGFYQFSPTSQFVKVLNLGDETPGNIDYTSIYGKFDELVEPSAPVPTAALDWQQHNPHVANILLQNVCPDYIVDHVTIGTTDRLTFNLTMDAITHPGPANVDRAGGKALCNKLAPLLPQENIGAYTVTGILKALTSEDVSSIPNLHLAASEPRLKPYAQAYLDRMEQSGSTGN